MRQPLQTAQEETKRLACFSISKRPLSSLCYVVRQLEPCPWRALVSRRVFLVESCLGVPEASVPASPRASLRGRR